MDNRDASDALEDVLFWLIGGSLLLFWLIGVCAVIVSAVNEVVGAVGQWLF